MSVEGNITVIDTISVSEVIDLTLRSNGDVLITLYTPYDSRGVLFEVHSVVKTKLPELSEAVGKLNEAYSRMFETVYMANISGEEND